MRPTIITSVILLAGLASCSLHSQPKTAKLTSADLQLSDSIRFNKEVLLKIRTYTDSAFTHFKFDQHFLDLDSSKEVQTITTALPGVLFHEQPKQASLVITKLRDELEQEGYFIFLSDNNFGINNQPDEVGVVKADNQFAVLSYRQTDGINYGIDNDSLITLMKSFHERYDLKLVGAGLDWCEFVIQKEPEDWLALAKEVYKVCPDVVDQGTETVEALAEEMRKSRRLYFWWD